MNIFERASRSKLRFNSSVGDLTTEQLWDLPLTAKGDRPDLDKLARGVNRELKSVEEESFVATKPNPRANELQLQLEILKHIIASKVADAAAHEKAAVNAARKRTLMNILATKQEQELAGMSREQIEAEIARLEA